MGKNFLMIWVLFVCPTIPFLTVAILTIREKRKQKHEEHK